MWPQAPVSQSTNIVPHEYDCFLCWEILRLVLETCPQMSNSCLSLEWLPWQQSPLCPWLIELVFSVPHSAS